MTQLCGRRGRRYYDDAHPRRHDRRQGGDAVASKAADHDNVLKPVGETGFAIRGDAGLADQRVVTRTEIEGEGAVAARVACAEAARGG